MRSFQRWSRILAETEFLLDFCHSYHTLILRWFLVNETRSVLLLWISVENSSKSDKSGNVKSA